MIRWRYVFPRLIALTIGFLVFAYGVPPVVRLVTVKTLQAATGARVDLASVDVGLFPPRLRYIDIQVANPGRDKAMRNLATADTVELVIDAGALLRRRFVVQDARISGLEFDSERLTSGHFEPDPTPPSDQPSLAMRWLTRLIGSASGAAQDQLDALADGSVTIRRGDQIRRRWKNEYRLLADRAGELESAIKEVQETAKGIENPLRDWARVDATLTQAKQIREELIDLRRTLDELPSQVQSDLASLERAKQADLQRIHELSPIDLTAGDNLAPGLLLRTVETQIARLRGYLDTGREVSRWTVAKPKAERFRGELIDLDGGRRSPSQLVRRCEVSGMLRAGGQPYRLAGILENLTPQPQLRAEPLRARLKLDGAESVRLDYLRDDSTEIAAERLTLHWPGMKAPDFRIGSDETLELDIRDGQVELWVQLNIRDEQIEGRLVSRRIDTRVAFNATDKVARTPMFRTLQDRLAAVDRVEIDAELTGTWSRPDISVRSNLTGVLSAAVRDATHGQLAATKRKLEAEIDQAYLGQLSELQQWLTAEQVKTSELLVSADNKIQEISRKVLRETNKADAYLSRLRGQLPGMR